MIEETKTDVAVLKNDLAHIKGGIDDIKRMLEKGDERMDKLDSRVQCVEQTLYGLNGDPGLVKRVEKNTEEIQGFKIKAAAMGALAGVLGWLGTSNLGSLSSILSGK